MLVEAVGYQSLMIFIKWNICCDVGEEVVRNAERTHYTGGWVAREWRGRRGHVARPQRRIAPERYLNGSYPFQVKFTPDDLLNGQYLYSKTLNNFL